MRFSKLPPYEGHSGKGYSPRIPDAVLHSNDRDVYAAFVRGLFEADGNANHGYVYWMTSCEEFSRDVQTLLLTLGFVSTRDIQDSWGRLGGAGLSPASSERELGGALRRTRSALSPSARTKR